MSNLHLVGHIGQDPKTTQYGQTTIATFSVGVTENVKNKEGKWDSITYWYELKAFNKMAESVAKLSKGDLVEIHGDLKPTTYKNKEGKTVKDIQILLERFKRLVKAEQKQKPVQYHNDTQNLSPQDLEPQDGDMPF